VQTLSTDQLACITHLYRACGGMTTEIDTYLSSYYFTRAKGRALVLQPAGAVGYFYLAPSLFSDPARRTRELSLFIGIMTMLDALKRSGKILCIQHHDPARRASIIRALGDSFESPIVRPGRIVLNAQGDYTSHPDTIKNKADVDIYMGVKLEGPLFEMVNSVTSGLVYLGFDIETLIRDAGQQAIPMHPASSASKPAAGAPAEPQHAAELPAADTSAPAPKAAATPEGAPAAMPVPDSVSTTSLAPSPKASDPGVLVLFMLASGLAMLAFVIVFLYQFNNHAKELNQIQMRILATFDKLGSSIRDPANPPAAAPKKERPVDATARRFGFDLSKWNSTLAAKALATPHVSFVIVRATSGLVKDPAFDANWSLIKNHHVRRGAYHFYHASEDPIMQAKVFLQAIGSRDPRDIAPIIDFEELSFKKNAPVQHPELVRENLLKILDHVEAETGRTPMLYTNVATGDKYLSDPRFSRYPLWIADWTKKDNPALPAAWKTVGYVYWQRSPSYTLKGASPAPIDMDIYGGESTADMATASPEA